METGDFSFPCTKCGARFNGLRDLRKHKCSSEGEGGDVGISEDRKFKCKTDVIPPKTEFGDDDFISKKESLSNEQTEKRKTKDNKQKETNKAKGKQLATIDNQVETKKILDKKYNYVTVKLESGEKLYQCGNCKYMSSRSNHLKVHSYMHTGKKPYQCGSCDFSSRGANHLTRHIKTHKNLT